MVGVGDAGWGKVKGFMLGMLKVFFVVTGALFCFYSGNLGAELYVLLNFLCSGAEMLPHRTPTPRRFPVYAPNVSIYSNIMERYFAGNPPTGPQNTLLKKF